MYTLSCTFFLKKPKSKTETLILFSCYFKMEEKKFVYSTGEKIKPEYWDFKHRQPINHGRSKFQYASAIRKQLNRYSDKFDEVQVRCKTFNEDFTRQILRDAFDKEFKKVKPGRDLFFRAYEEFMDFRIKNYEWSKNTITRYNNVKGILKDFQIARNYKLTFNAINFKFQAEFMDYCLKERDHKNNTYSRNLVLIKSFMHYALENGYTYKEDFKKFKKRERVITQQIALTLEDLQKLMNYKFHSKRLEQTRDLFVFASVTGMRYGELRYVGRHSIQGDEIHLKEEKDSQKVIRMIPLNDIAKYILKKYDYRLPLISNQKQNDNLKDVFKKAEFTQEVQKVTTHGKEIIRETMPFYARITTHTARRTFITMMKRKGLSDKLIASITGHKDLKTLNQYYQVDDEAKSEAVKQVFNIGFQYLKKVD